MFYAKFIVTADEFHSPRNTPAWTLPHGKAPQRSNRAASMAPARTQTFRLPAAIATKIATSEFDQNFQVNGPRASLPQFFCKGRGKK